MSDGNEKCVWNTYTDEEFKKVFTLGDRYKEFMSQCKTERECVKAFVRQAEENGYKNLKDVISNNVSLKPGDKVYADNYGKMLVLFTIGTEPFEKGLRILGAHIDAPRIDLKINPLYEDTGFAMAKTHYYGGIKKYQWVTMPLALHGVVVKKDGTVVNVTIGEKDDDPVLGVSDLLIHLAKDQMDKKLKEGITAEDLNVLMGTIPLKDCDEENPVKNNILRILNKRYGIDERDFASSELEIVPAGRARDYGLDSSMVMAYGQDDRASAFSCFEAAMKVENPDKTCVTILCDKEEIGSVGNTSMRSRFFDNMLAEVMELCGDYSELKIRRALSNSKMLSCDVNPAYDPNYSSVMDKQNSGFAGYGLIMNKFMGAGGKSGTNDANPEYVAEIRNLMDRHNVAIQFAEFGKVDQGGGGTISYILAAYNMNVIDCGIPVINVHAPWEISSKADMYEAVNANHVFLLEI